MSDFISLEELRRQYPDEAACRELLEELVWPKGAYCPHCGSLKVWRFRANGRKSRPGLFQCGEKECRLQFTVTTKTPLHATKLPLWTWIAAMYLMLSSSKGISSVVMARYLGVTQPTAWKICHAIRELMDLRHEQEPVLSGIVEVDTKRLGGAPKFRRNVRHPRGKGSKKPIVLVAAERKGQIRAQLIKSESAAEMGSVIDRVVAKAAMLMSDADRALIKIGKTFKAHHTVVHSKRQYVENEAHTGTADHFASVLERAKIGIYHRLSRVHLQRYIDEAVFRWNQRRETVSRKSRGATRILWRPRPIDLQFADLLICAVGRQVRRSAVHGLRFL